MSVACKNQSKNDQSLKIFISSKIYLNTEDGTLPSVTLKKYMKKYC